MKLRISHRHGDRRPVGYITSEPAFAYELAADTPQREEIVALIEESSEWTAPRYGGTEDPDASCGGYTRVPATPRDRVALLAQRLPSVADVTVAPAEE